MDGEKEKDASYYQPPEPSISEFSAHPESPTTYKAGFYMNRSSITATTSNSEHGEGDSEIDIYDNAHNYHI